ncbi:hypothetical protein SCYAM73S_02965 [Streptomyces cyaneofuscatus]
MLLRVTVLTVVLLGLVAFSILLAKVTLTPSPASEQSMTSSDATTDTAPQSGKTPTPRPGRGLLKAVGVCAAVLALIFAAGKLSLLPGLDSLLARRPTTGPAPRSSSRSRT